ncbi:MAG: TIM barrel protein [Fimbriimonadaceae bacterium]
MKPDAALDLLSTFKIETPSWGYADTGTRFGKFFQDAAAATIQEKLADAGTVHDFTGAAPTVALHAQWDFDAGRDLAANAKPVMEYAKKAGVRIGAINPNLFEDQVYKFGSACSPNPEARAAADRHVRDCIEYARLTGSTSVSLWFGDGTNYPGQDSIVARKRLMHAALKGWHDALVGEVELLIEYKPFEPAFYHTDIADWGMAYAYAKAAGPMAKVLVDTGHHLPGANIEHIVAFLIDEGMLGGFHFNDRKYGDDDLTLGSVDPYAAFRIFCAIADAVEDGSLTLADVGFCIDQSHNMKPKIEAMVQTVCVAQELFLKALLVDRAALKLAQNSTDIVGGETCLTRAFSTDVRPMLAEFRAAAGIAPDPLAAYRGSGHEREVGRVRGERNRAKRLASSYA